MSLEQAAALMEERKKRQSLDRGINAGRAAYEGRAPQRSGIGDVPVAQVRSSVESALQQAAAQRQALADAATKQSLGQYTNTGTSAAAYDYLRAKPGATYPVNPVLPQGMPVQRPYEEATRPGRVSQTQTSKEAKETTKMPTVNRAAPRMPEQGMLGQLLDLALPAYLGYKGYQWLTGAEAASPYAATSTATFLPGAASGIPEYAAAGYTGGAATPTAIDMAANTAAPAIDWSAAGYGGDAALADALAGASAGALPAGIGGATWDPTVLMSDPYYVGEVAGAAGASGLAGALPYVGAALLVDQLTGGGLGETIGDAVQGVGDVVEDVWEGVTGGCFLTTAAVKHMGQDDNGEVLNTLREFRDTYMRKNKEKSKDVEWYYENAPRIVNALDKLPDADAVYKKMYKRFILPAYHAIKKGENERAYKIYKNLVNYVEDHAGMQRGKDIAPRYGKRGMADGGLTALAGGGMGHLGGYSDGGRLLRGPGDGVSDSIPATIGEKRQPARLADGEFVVPARIVSELGNGSTEAGARKLYAMMDRIQSARKKSVGKGKVAVNSRAEKYLPK